MLGYIVPDKAELKVREYEIYKGYYCGVCKRIGSAYGQLPRMLLSYDAAFLALMLAAVDDAPDAPAQEHCVMHHLKYQTIIRNPAISFAADAMLILARYKLQDDADDENRLPAKAGLTLLRKTNRDLDRKYPALSGSIRQQLADLSHLEADHCSSLDLAAESSAKIMELVLSEGTASLYPDRPHLHETFAKIGYHVGKWVYLIDAADDIEKDLEEGTYNPLLYRFGYDGERETPQSFRARIDEMLRFNLFQYLAVIGECAAALDLKKNSGIIDNIIYFGLNRRTEEVLKRIPVKRRSMYGLGPYRPEKDGSRIQTSERGNTL